MINIRNINTDFVAAIGTLAIALLFGLNRELWTPLSARWPNAILVFILACAIFLLLRAFIKPERASIIPEGSRRRILMSVVLLVIWASLIEHLGFLTTSILVFYCFWWFVTRAAKMVEGDHSPIGKLAYARAMVVTVMLVGGFHYVFTTYLFVPLPRGILI